MNKIQKTYPAPAILTTKGQQFTETVIGQAESGKGKLSFDYGTYGHPSIKAQLIADQHNKCVYCEQSLNGDFDDVEHYRPKAGYCTTGTKRTSFPCLTKPAGTCSTETQQKKPLCSSTRR